MKFLAYNMGVKTPRTFYITPINKDHINPLNLKKL